LTPAGALRVDNSTVTQPGNITQWNGNTVDTNSGVKSAGTLRVVVATDQPALTNPLLTTIQQGGNSANVNASGQLIVNCAAGCAASSAADTTGSGTLNGSNAQAPAAPGLALAGT